MNWPRFSISVQTLLASCPPLGLIEPGLPTYTAVLSAAATVIIH